MKILETIVVEGRDDETAIKKAVDADIIKTSGFGITPQIFQQIEWAQQKNGVIVFTDPDWAGERIRERINKRIPGCKNAYLDQSEALKKDNIGVENAKPESIVNALINAKVIINNAPDEYSMEDLIANKLSMFPQSSKRRAELGKKLRIGYGNSKQFLKRLNHYQIQRSAFYEALEEIKNLESIS